MRRRVDRLAYESDATGRTRRGLVVHHTHGLDRVVLIFTQAGFKHGGIGTAAPVGGNEFGDDAQTQSHFVPQRSELTGFEHQYPIAGR